MTKKRWRVNDVRGEYEQYGESRGRDEGTSKGGNGNENKMTSQPHGYPEKKKSGISKHCEETGAAQV